MKSFKFVHANNDEVRLIFYCTDTGTQTTQTTTSVTGIVLPLSNQEPRKKEQIPGNSSMDMELTTLKYNF